MPIHRRTAVALVAALLVSLAVAPASAGQGEPVAQRESMQNPTATPRPTEPVAWAWPLALPHRVLREFRAPVSEYADGHRGIDLAAHAGDPVYAVADGTLTFAGIVVDRPAVSLSHGDGLVSSMEPVLALVAAGDSVRRGQLIGRVATGGHCGDGCLHLGARTSGRYVSPMRYLGGVPHAVLLPAESANVLRQRQDSRRSAREQELWRAVLQEDGLENDGHVQDPLRGIGGGQARG
ncbi:MULTISPECIES: M23 family metallopeptidase [unclassified Cryobacterium]|uniref:M23 family metallopeptidase n=1 Tax=unclassified Cryobacterium TaxID=2649013 RepID=UPI002AB453F4|nr:MULTISPECIES: M23 family metallopeptidase [unclassified Cryobacterium]MDY7544251.1 M23 family metallopeptidase [Cryobacterium sp. 5B3]MEA9997827.1 M23 family metallopeptidase [Cryobacterium sp. RTS3]MEB0264617.1 M23 family metallopeptidase [Cryobacterium sp. 10I5]MEB0273850.1 M23 family metallopeptidase [Cryobacterium sp. 5B3]